MLIAGYLKTSLIEWPGKICSVIFTQGCNFQCPFCHNRELVGNGFTQIGDGFTRIDEQVVLEDLKKRRKWIDVVAITGGEPTLQKDLPEFLGKLGVLGMLRMVETNGSRPEVVAKLVGGKLVDKWSMDVKVDFGNYLIIQNANLKMQNLIQNVKTSIGLIANSGVEYEFRTTVVPGIHNLTNLKQLAGEIGQICQIGPIGSNKATKRFEPKWFLQQFRPINCLDKDYLKKKPFTKVEMDEFLAEVQKIVPNTYLRGV